MSLESQASGLAPDLPAVEAVADPEELASLLKNGWQVATAGARPVLSTYRVQLSPGSMDFAAAARLAPYLAALGVSHLYASPHLRARPGSTHGYDVVDHQAINPELGSEWDLECLHAALRENGLQMLLDWVPNHMAIGRQNPAWLDVLENGPSARSARFFDIDWAPVKAELANKVLIPILGDQYGVVLERAELQLRQEQGGIWLAYFDHRFPIGPKAYAIVLKLHLERLADSLGTDHPDLLELLSILTAIEYLPPRTETAPARVEERRREKEIIKRRLTALCEASAPMRAHLAAALEELNGRAGEPSSFRTLHELLELQGYRLAFWRTAAEEVNYRRFFDVNELAAIRVEDPEVFRQTHQLLWKWVQRGWVRALRIDHPDGLFDPGEYLLQLQTHALLACCQASREGLARKPAPRPDFEAALRQLCREELTALGKRTGLPLHVVVEKILGRRERLPDSWAVSGTTGYDFLNAVNGVLVDGAGAEELDRAYSQFLGCSVDYWTTVYESKKLILETALASELQVLAHRADRISEHDWRTRDFTLGALQAALAEVIACFPVYRTYIPQEGSELDSRDRKYVETAVALARKRSPATSRTVFDFLRNLLLKNHPADTSPEVLEQRLAFLGKFQQLTGPVMAKGMEDTTFYGFNRLVSLNEVGGEPDRIGVPPAQFHAQNLQRLSQAPGSLLSTTTHDTKRAEDVRLRIDVLSEIPQEWAEAAGAWARMNERLRRDHGGVPAPDRNDEYLLYQTLLGTWPDGNVGEAELDAYRQRIEAYVLKAAREAKTHTSWIEPSPEYEEALIGFARGLLSRSQDHPFWRSFHQFLPRVCWAARQSSLSQVVLKLASPGIPDIYQGSELWDLRLVDPDNRGPVDFERRARLLDGLAKRCRDLGPKQLAAEAAAYPEDGAVKLFVLWRGLTMRRERGLLFLTADYSPLECTGERAGHVVAFVRTSGPSAAIAAVGRLFVRLAREVGRDCSGVAAGEDWWGQTRLPLPQPLWGRQWRERFTDDVLQARVDGERGWLELGEVFSVLPVALLEALPE
ncbi:MAG: malto-oligosyltrehalose synthase [Candidatus Riflebacteria bacterium]|nr:malto-oligosyltrehalose synthase [Candidatus Riflebacteria bacterium]